ncbi:MAG: hypothetical protein P8Y98_14900 [Anaerolineales bacterium]
MKRIKKTGWIVMLLVAILIVAGALTAFAQDEKPPHPPHGWLDGEIILAVYAEALGITPEEVEAAWAEGKTLTDLCDELGLDLEETRSQIDDRLQTLRAEAIQQAVDDGEISQELADDLFERDFPLEHAWTGGGRDRFKTVPGAGREGFFPHEGPFDDQLRGWRESGLTLEQWAEENDVDLDQLKADIQAEHEERVQQMLEEGIITEEQAQELLDQDFPEDFPGPRMPFRGRGPGHFGCE